MGKISRQSIIAFILTAIFLASSSVAFGELVFSGWVKDMGEFTADGITYNVLSSGDLLSVVLQSKTNTVVIYNASCAYASRYKFCMSDYRFAHFQDKRRLNGADPEEYLINASTTYKNAKLELTRTADKKVVFVGNNIEVNTRIKNSGDTIASEVHYVERFPDSSYVNSVMYSGLIKERRLNWDGTIAPDTLQDLSYDIYFTNNGTFTIPLTLNYYDGEIYQKIEESLTFNVENEYYVTFQGKNEIELDEPMDLTVTFSGKPLKLLYVELVLPAEMNVMNTTFDRHFGVNSWEGNFSMGRNFTTKFYSEDEGEYEAYADVSYVGSNIHNKYPFKFNITHKKIDVSYIVKDGKISVFAKNNNNYATFKNIQIMLAGAYSNLLTMKELKPKKEELVLSEPIGNINGPISIRANYMIGDINYAAAIGAAGNDVEDTAADTPVANETAAANSGSANSQGNQAGNQNAAAQANDANVPAEIQPATEPSAPEEKDNRGFIEKFFDWLSSIF